MVQWIWYADMIRRDKEEDFESKLQFIEYLAQFSEPERVKKVKEHREHNKQHAFASNDEFEKQVADNEFKSNPYVDAIRKIRENNDKLLTNSPNKNKRRNIPDQSIIDKALKD